MLRGWRGQEERERELLLSGVCAESRSAEWDIVLRMLTLV